MSKNSRGFVPLLLIMGVVLLGIAGIGYLLVKNGQINVSNDSLTVLSPTPNEDRCKLEPDPGICEAYIPSYFFNPDTNACEEFIWGGCVGVRPFETLKKCQTQCETQSGSGLKIYRNERNGFEFRYPSKDYIARIDNEKEYGKRNSINLVDDYKEFKEMFPPQLIHGVRVESTVLFEGQSSTYKLIPFSAWVFANTEKRSIDQWIEKYQYYPFQWGESTAPHKEFKEGSLVGREAVLSPLSGSRLIYVQKNNLMFLINVWGEPQSKGIGTQILSTFKLVGKEVSWKCIPLFEIDTGPGLTASQDYSLECYTATTKEDCEKVDVYEKLTNSFGNPDGWPDCAWIVD